MKIRELFESKESFHDVLAKCAPYLNMYGGRSAYMFRGMRSLRADFEIVKVGDEEIKWCVLSTDKNRTPKTSSKRMHKAVDEYFLSTFGWRGRSQGVFATGSARFASYFGTPYIIIPIGPTKFIWSEEVEDLYTYFNERLMGSDSDKAVERLISAMPELEYKDRNLATALRCGHEIMVDCDQYLVIQYNAEQAKALKELLGF